AQDWVAGIRRSSHYSPASEGPAAECRLLGRALRTFPQGWVIRNGEQLPTSDRIRRHHRLGLVRSAPKTGTARRSQLLAAAPSSVPCTRSRRAVSVQVA